jgi:hypothetical protein
VHYPNVSKTGCSCIRWQNKLWNSAVLGFWTQNLWNLRFPHGSCVGEDLLSLTWWHVTGQVVSGTYKDKNAFIFREWLQSCETLGTTHIQHSIISQKIWTSGTETGWWNWEMNSASRVWDSLCQKKGLGGRLLTSYCHVMKVTEPVCVEML